MQCTVHWQCSVPRTNKQELSNSSLLWQHEAFKAFQAWTLGGSSDTLGMDRPQCVFTPLTPPKQSSRAPCHGAVLPTAAV